MDMRDLCLGNGKIDADSLGISSVVSSLSFIFLIFVPSGIYLLGAGLGWIAFSFFLGFSLIWELCGFRLMRYTKKYKNVKTISQYLAKRFKDDGHIVQFISAVIITVSSFSIAVFALHAGAKTFEQLFDMKHYVALILIALTALLPAFLSGFAGVYRLGKLKGVIVLICIMCICFAIFITLGTRTIFENIMQGWSAGNVSRYVNALYSGGILMDENVYINYFSYGLAVFGMPGLLMYFMTTKSARVMVKAKRLTIILTLLITFACCIMGGMSRAMIFPVSVQRTSTTHIYFVRELFFKLTQASNAFTILTGYLYMIVILAVYSALLEICLHVIVAEITNDFISDMIFSGRNKVKDVVAYRGTLIGILLLVMYFNLETSDKISELVFLLFMIMTTALGPVIVLSLRWHRMTKKGALAGMLTACVAVPMLKYLKYIPADMGYQSFSEYSRINPILPAIILSTFAVVVASLFSKKPDKDMIKDYNDVKNRIASE